MADSAFEIIATGLQQIIATEFQPEGFTAIFDNLHESLGRTRTDIGIAPEQEYPNARYALMNEIFVEIRFYDLWKQEISPETVVDPTRITGFAARLQDAIGASTAATPGEDLVWYYDVRRTTYPPDPTGNKTRFHMQVRAFGNNTGLVETSP